METQILVPLDGSDLSRTALPHALALARATGSTILLLQVIPAPHVGYVEPMAWPAECDASASVALQAKFEAAQCYLQHVAAQLEQARVAIRTVVVAGEPGRAIVDVARQQAAGSLIVMATHGRSGLSRWLWGSIADQVLDSTPIPLLLVRQGEPCPDTDQIAPAVYQRILVPLDKSTFAEQLLPIAQQLVSAIDGTLYLAGVAPGNDNRAFAEGGLVPWWMLEAEEDRYHQMEAYLNTVADGLSRRNIDVTPEVVRDTPAAGILKVIAERQIDLVVMATRERSLVRHLVDPSVTLQVMRDSNVPLMLMRMPEQLSSHPRKAARSHHRNAVDTEFEPRRRKGAAADLFRAG